MEAGGHDSEKVPYCFEMRHLIIHLWPPLKKTARQTFQKCIDRKGRHKILMGLDPVEGFELSPHPLLDFESYAHKEDRWPDILTMCRWEGQRVLKVC